MSRGEIEAEMERLTLDELRQLALKSLLSVVTRLEEPCFRDSITQNALHVGVPRATRNRTARPRKRPSADHVPEHAVRFSVGHYPFAGIRLVPHFRRSFHIRPAGPHR